MGQHEATTSSTAKMLSRTAMRLPNTVARRGFSTTRAQFNSPYHYPEGPRSSIPFNPLTRWFALRYWGFMGLGFGLPFGIAVWQNIQEPVRDCIACGWVLRFHYEMGCEFAHAQRDGQIFAGWSTAVSILYRSERGIRTSVVGRRVVSYTCIDV